ncbi:type II toxin-antitoxin system RelE/ParE family toxin [Antarcticirhabdus aurantiaca]|uniref:Type II toxin-antitoxin system RelE/ParE family toxin n=1 Tax=Antarcticirhabdus aurantiaca TaxID=2606717 RepID=A0ACD4NP56_9HYPH|nr:type II toxin-antitoxin system RelE/ParE family toxin [Antarcticirhabdus aurantiaca]WAJ28568.1 type II toxin-antitoxin system RelE/ParE family toxin [Jeongeuplla avenae]
MPRLIVTSRAAAGLDRCRRFLNARDAQASRRASDVIRRQFRLLSDAPEIGRPVPDDLPGLRELPIHFGASGYVALYTYDRLLDAVIILAFRHMKEAGY